MEIAETNIGERIRQLRKSRGFSQSELSRRSGLASGMISDIEAGKKSPTIRSVSQLAAALQVSMSALFATVGSTSLTEVVRKNERQRLVDPETGAERLVLSPALLTRGLEVVIYRAPAGSPPIIFAPLESHVAVQLTVIRGSCRWQVETVTHQLQEGDSLSFPGYFNATFAADGEQTCECLLVIDRTRDTP